MINDHIKDLKRYGVPQAETILEFIASHDCFLLPDGEMEIDGRQLFVRIMSYIPKPAQENRFEIHRSYADLQYVVKGAEIMQTARLDALEALGEYDPAGDYQFFKIDASVSSLIVNAGEFAVFYPNEPHRPSCALEGYHESVKKLVFKIKIN